MNKKQIRKMQNASGGPLFPWQQNTEWVNDWKFRTTPASRSKVLSGKGVETDKQYTERRKKEETKRTWKSDAADIAHGIGEGVLALNPYTAIPYFGAKVGQDALNGNVSWQTALNASVPLFHLAPQAVGLREATNVALEDAANAGSKTARNWRVAREIKQATKNKPNMEVPKPIIRTKVGDVEINNPGLYYHQSDAGKAKNFVSTGRMRTPLEESWLAKEEAGEHIPIKIRSGIVPGYPQDPGSAMFAQGNLWYGLTTNKPDLLVTAREMPIANKNASVMSNKASLRQLEAQGTRRVTNDNIYTQGPHNRQNTTAYTWVPRYGYKKVTQEPSTSLKFFERKPSKISEAERAGVSKGDRNQHFKSKQLTEHVQGDEAVKMFKEYGGEPIPEGSINGEQLRKYVAEARERYGLTNNKNITDEEIAQALYKHSKELGGNTAAVNAQGEPQLLFRGDTRRYTQLKERMSPEELAIKKGTMDNSLGNLFLGELPGTAGKRTRGLERYLVTGREFRGNKVLEGSGTGSKAIMPDGTFASEWGKDIVEFPEGSYPLVTYNTKYGPNIYYKLPSSYSESGVNDINAYVVRTPQVRDASREISVLNDDFMVKGGPKVEYHGPIRKEVLDKDGFPLIVDEKGNVVADGLAGSSDRQAMTQHYRYVLNDAKNKKQGLLKSNGETDGTPGNYLRDEHDDYTYFALPNFNIQGAKHLLPYDLRIPRNWKDKNIYRGLIPLTTGYTLYNIFNQPQQQLQYQKQGGKMNILEFLKNGSGIHIKEKNKGKFTDYCGGKVTDECIQKGKNSSNPAIRKRAVFAANARKWKHKEGGTVKAQEGTKFNWGSAIGNLASTALQQGISTYMQNKKLSSDAEADKERYKSEAASKLQKDMQDERTKRFNILNAIKGTSDNPNAFGGGIFENYFINQGDNEAIRNYNQSISDYNKMIDQQIRAQKAENTGNFLSSLGQQGVGLLANSAFNKNSTNTSSASTSATSSTNTSYNLSNFWSTPSFSNYLSNQSTLYNSDKFWNMNPK